MLVRIGMCSGGCLRFAISILIFIMHSFVLGAELYYVKESRHIGDDHVGLLTV